RHSIDTAHTRARGNITRLSLHGFFTQSTLFIHELQLRLPDRVCLWIGATANRLRKLPGVFKQPGSLRSRFAPKDRHTRKEFGLATHTTPGYGCGFTISTRSLHIP